jgi:hypothetical protein
MTDRIIAVYLVDWTTAASRALVQRALRPEMRTQHFFVEQSRVCYKRIAIGACRSRRLDLLRLHVTQRSETSLASNVFVPGFDELLV